MAHDSRNFLNFIGLQVIVIEVLAIPREHYLLPLLYKLRIVYGQVREEYRLDLLWFLGVDIEELGFAVESTGQQDVLSGVELHSSDHRRMLLSWVGSDQLSEGKLLWLKYQVSLLIHVEIGFKQLSDGVFVFLVYFLIVLSDGGPGEELIAT